MSFAWKQGAPKVAFITGGSSGIGFEFARLLAREGCSVAIFNRRLAPDAIDKLQAEAASSQQRFVSYAADVSDVDCLEAAISSAVAEFGEPELAINAAGVTVSKPFEALSAEDFNYVININLVGSRNFASAVLPHLNKGSHLVLVSSIAGLVSN